MKLKGPEFNSSRNLLLESIYLWSLFFTIGRQYTDNIKWIDIKKIQSDKRLPNPSLFFQFTYLT